jgi:hypothetical protein
MFPFQLQRPSVEAQTHRNGERVLRGGQMVAEDAVQGGQQSFPPANPVKARTA